MVDHVRRFCADRGVEDIELDVWAFNDRARAFFQRAGFEPFASKLRCSVGGATAENQKTTDWGG